MKLNVENIAKNIKKIWRQIYEVIDTSFFAETKHFPLEFQINVKILQQTSVPTIWSQSSFEKNGYGKRFIYTSSDYPPKGFR